MIVVYSHWPVAIDVYAGDPVRRRAWRYSVLPADSPIPDLYADYVRCVWIVPGTVQP